MAFCFKDSQIGKFYDDINFVFVSVTSEHVPKSHTQITYLLLPVVNTCVRNMFVIFKALISVIIYLDQTSVNPRRSKVTE